MINYSIWQIKTNHKEGLYRILHAFDTRESMRSHLLNRPSHAKNNTTNTTQSTTLVEYIAVAKAGGFAE